MNVCTKCGCKLEDGVQFCQNCGMKRGNPIIKKQKMNKGTKIWIILLSLFIIAIVGLYMYGSSYYSQEAQLDRIITVLQEKDGDQLVDMITTDDPGVVVNRESVMPLFSYIKENPSYVSELKAYIKQGQKKNGIEGVDFSVTKDGAYFFLFDRYKLKTKTYYATLLTNEKDTVLKVNGKELDKTNDKDFEKQYGPFLPGIQIFQSEFKSEYAKLAREEKVVLMKQNQKNVTVDLTLKGQYITVQTNAPDATLYVNQKPVTTLTGEEMTWGPVSTDGSVSIYLERNGENGRETTKMENVTNSLTYNLPFQKKSTEKTVVYNVSPQVTTQYVYNGFFFPDSDIRKLTSADLRYLSKEQLKIARNEIYARHGYIFQTEDMQAYFSKQSWYREKPYYTGALSDIEAYNVELIKSKE